MKFNAAVHQRQIGRALIVAWGVVVVAGLTRCGRSEQADLPQGQLVDAVLENRFTAGRYSQQTGWDACRNVDSAASVIKEQCALAPAPGSPAFQRLDDAARQVRNTLLHNASPASLYVRALVDAQWNTAFGADLARAASLLQQAAKADSNNANPLNDVAVLQLAVAEQTQDLLPLLGALDAVERAAALPTHKPAVHFNRALILERLALYRGSEREWRTYLDLESSSRWRDEATRRLTQMQQRQRFTQPAFRNDSLLMTALMQGQPLNRGIAQHDAVWRREASWRLLSEWGKAVLSRDTARARVARGIVHELAAAEQAGSDRTITLSMASLPGETGAADDTGAKQGAALQARRTANAYIRFDEGLTQLFFGRDVQRSEATLQRAVQELRALGSPVSDWAACYHAAAVLIEGQYARGDRLLAEVLRGARTDMPAVRARSLLSLGTSHIRQAHYQNAIEHFSAAQHVLSGAGERELSGVASASISEALALQGEDRGSLDESARALSLLSPFPRSRQWGNQIALLAAQARSASLPHAAIAIVNETLDMTHATVDTGTLAILHSDRARDYVAIGNVANARTDLDSAEYFLDKLSPSAEVDRLRAGILAARGEIERARSPNASLATLLHALRMYEGLDEELFRPATQYQAALSARALGDTAQSLKLLTAAVRELERQHATVTDVVARVRFAETAERVFDAVINQVLDGNDDAGAFEYLERGRRASWSAAPALSSAMASRVASLAGIAGDMPEGMVMIEYALLDSRLAVWVAWKDGWQSFTVPITRDSVRALVDALPSELESAVGDERRVRTRLFELLLRPVATKIASARRLIIIPDRELFRVPFAALWDSVTARYVIEDHEVALAPSAEFVQVTVGRQPRAMPLRSALIIGNPTLTRAMQQDLPALPGAAAEAREVAKLYHTKSVLVAADASVRKLRMLLPRSSVFHFAGHAVFNERQPERSFLALAPDTAGSADMRNGTLDAREIGNMRLLHTSLVVLSACQTLNPRASRMGPLAGLAFSFLRAGVPGTISTLWDVNDQSTTALLVDFHRALAAGSSAPAALRLAQIAALKSPERSRRSAQVWAAFTFTGS